MSKTVPQGSSSSTGSESVRVRLYPPQFPPPAYPAVPSDGAGAFATFPFYGSSQQQQPPVPSAPPFPGDVMFPPVAAAGAPAQPAAALHLARTNTEYEQTGTLDVAVTEPKICAHPSPLSVPGLRKRYVTYLVSSSSTMPAYSLQSADVRRRFSDFVALEVVLRVSHRGYFLPPRPAKNIINTQKLRRDFTEKRTKQLDMYLKRLASHRVISRSSELQIFLQERGELRNSSAWLSICNRPPSLAHGVGRLVKQVIGKEQLTPSPDHVVLATRHSHDWIRTARERFHDFSTSSQERPRLTEQEVVLRRRAEVMRSFSAALQSFSHATSTLHASHCLNMFATRELGAALTRLAAYEGRAMHMGMSSSLRSVGEGCLAVSSSAHTLLQSTAEKVQDHARSMNGMLDGLRTREEALLTMHTFAAHRDAKRTRVATLRAQRSLKAPKAEEELTLAEDTYRAAAEEYSSVARRNASETVDFVPANSNELLLNMYLFVTSVAATMEAEADAWFSIARGMGGNNSGRHSSSHSVGMRIV